MIDAVEEALGEKNVESDLRYEAERIAIYRRDLEEMKRLQDEAKDAILATRNLESQLDDTLNKMALGDTVGEAQAAVGSLILKKKIVESAKLILDREESDYVKCPVCESEHSKKDLESTLLHSDGQTAVESVSALGELEMRLDEAETLERDLINLRAKFATVEQSTDTVKTRIDSTNRDEVLPQVESDDLDILIVHCSERENSIGAQIDNHEERTREQRAKLQKLKEEGRFQTIQRRLIQAQQSKNRVSRIEIAYQEFVSFGESVGSVRDAVRYCLNERLAQQIPRVADNLSQAFAALTHHPWFDRLTIAPEKLPKLELQAASSQEPGIGHPTGVLNGQAESALQLVPYFAFSGEDTPTEVLLLMFDDPTQAFDEEHIEILVERLSELGRHVQLIVASQESERFRTMLPKNFEPGSYVIIEPTNWSYRAGPELKIEY